MVRLQQNKASVEFMALVNAMSMDFAKAVLHEGALEETIDLSRTVMFADQSGLSVKQSAMPW